MTSGKEMSRSFGSAAIQTLVSGVRAKKSSREGAYNPSYVPRLADIPKKVVAMAAGATLVGVSLVYRVLQGKAYEKGVPIEVMDSDLLTERLRNVKQPKYRDQVDLSKPFS